MENPPCFIGLLVCLDRHIGKILWQQTVVQGPLEKLGRHHASPVLIEGQVFFINDDGQVNVIRPAAQFERVARYELGESCYASPAISDGRVFLRGFQHLFCFGRARD